MTKEEFIKSCQQAMDSVGADGYLLAQCTNELILLSLAEQREQADMEQLYRYGLDIRIFSESGEVRFLRSSMEKDWKVRERLQDAELQADKDYWDEEQFLDIDTQKSDEKNGVAVATGGGRYRLPLASYRDAKVVIRNYLGYEEETGRAYPTDWRILRLVEGK